MFVVRFDTISHYDYICFMIVLIITFFIIKF